MSEAVSTAPSEKLRTPFFPADHCQIAPVHAWEADAQPSLLERGDNRTRLIGFEACLVSAHKWNIDYPGPSFKAERSVDNGIIETLSLSVTTLGPTSYNIKTSGYLYDAVSGAFFGMIDLRYFGKRMPRTLTFDLKEHRFPISTQIEIRFAVDGGGTPSVPKPPTITSVTLVLEEG
ncbi:hypothetical protein PSAB6_100205 [Paraburkholderia sabiae]|jgi:hypothetical protein|uniref:hypothetical protein n=1 Tax=Paraburkholderia sabiae TaxID=273251 RepID=UPI001CB6216E|nr:hypothetical protein [Paraburkholderia sabiae]CAG9191781.1 hypothetical protein PSAB6_100205 [Paraburkholderia sabiae]